ncbi:hypothetical protein BLOT_012219 [Blomia tropicalis]|nr:hypothetical protein BLOT_012219 [Blomia tropicalis]
MSFVIVLVFALVGDHHHHHHHHRQRDDDMPFAPCQYLWTLLCLPPFVIYLAVIFSQFKSVNKLWSTGVFVSDTEYYPADHNTFLLRIFIVFASTSSD